MGCGGSKDDKDNEKAKNEHEDAGKPEEKPKDAAKEAPKESAKETPKEAPKEAPKTEAKAQPEWLSEDLSNMMQDYFTRYDLDGSGTINSNDELKQLCTNLVVKLELDMDVSTIDEKVHGAGDMSKLEWTFETFKEWFVSEEQFAANRSWIPDDISDSDDERPAGENNKAYLKQGTYQLTMSGEGMEDTTWKFKVRYTNDQGESDPHEIKKRLQNDHALGFDDTPAKKPLGLHHIVAHVQNSDKSIHITKSYDVDYDQSTKEPRFCFTGECSDHCSAAGTWEDEETDAQADVVRAKLKVGKKGTFTMKKNPKEE